MINDLIELFAIRIIYSLLRNNHIDNAFKRRLQRAALFGYDHQNHHQREQQQREQVNQAGTMNGTPPPPSSSSAERLSKMEPSFVAICDREFPCHRTELP